MGISIAHLKELVRIHHGIELSDTELELVLPHVERCLAEVEKLRELDLSSVISGRLFRADEGGQA